MKKFFITASGTEIGKTYLTAALCYQLAETGYMAKAVKPVISGYEEGEENDTEILLKAQKLKVNQKNIATCSPWRFRAATTPNYAARLEGQKIRFDEVADFCQSTESDIDYLFIEGIGGVMCPLTEDKTILNLITRLKVPTILVVGSYLGSLSHSLTAYQSLKSRLVDDVRIVISESQENPMPLEETVNQLAAHTDCPIMVIPRGMDSDFRNAPDITKLII